MRLWISGQARRRTGRPLRGSLRPMKTTFPLRPPGSAVGGRSIPLGITSNGPPMCGSAARRAASETAMRWSIRLPRAPHSTLPTGYQPRRSPAEWQVATIGQGAVASVNDERIGA